MVTSIVPVSDGNIGMVSRKTNHPVDKGMIFDVTRAKKNLVVKAPVHIGDVLVEIIAGSGADRLQPRISTGFKTDTPLTPGKPVFGLRRSTSSAKSFPVRQENPLRRIFCLSRIMFRLRCRCMLHDIMGTVKDTNHTDTQQTTKQPPLVLLHGLGQDAASWKPVIRHLLLDKELVAPE